MSDLAAQSVRSGRESVDATSTVHVPAAPQSLRVKYVVRTVRTDDQLKAVCLLRVNGYSARLPDHAAALVDPEPEDRLPGTVLFLVTRKSDGVPVATARLTTNIQEPIEFESHIRLPDTFDGHLLAQGGRVAVLAGEDNPLVLRLLFKAMHSCCRAMDVSFVIVAAESPRDRFFKGFGFREVYPGKQFLVRTAMGHATTLLYFDIRNTSDFLAKNPAHLQFLQTYCPDIEIFSSLHGSWLTPRRL